MAQDGRRPQGMPDGTQHGVAAERFDGNPRAPCSTASRACSEWAEPAQTRIGSDGSIVSIRRIVPSSLTPDVEIPYMTSSGARSVSRPTASSVLGLANDLVSSVRQDLPEQTAHEYMIFDDEDAGHGFGVLSGIGRQG